MILKCPMKTFFGWPIIASRLCRTEINFFFARGRLISNTGNEIRSLTNPNISADVSARGWAFGRNENNESEILREMIKNRFVS